MKNFAVFLDRDGVIIKDVNNLETSEQIKLIPNATEAIHLLNKENIPVSVVTNQPGIARGLITEQDLKKIHKDLKEILSNNNAKIDAVYYCPHHPNANVKEYREVCNCRKPEPGMLIQGAKDLNIDIKDCYMIGDRNSDVLAGIKAKCKITINVLTGTNKPILSGSVSQEEINNTKPDYICKDLLEAVQLILRLEKG